MAYTPLLFVDELEWFDVAGAAAGGFVMIIMLAVFFRTICVLSLNRFELVSGSRVYYVDYFSCKLHKASWRRACFWFNAFKLEERIKSRIFLRFAHSVTSTLRLQ